MRLIIILFISISFLYFSSKANEKPNNIYGVYGAFNFANHNTNFQSLPGVNSCAPYFENSSGTGFSFGALYQYPFEKNLSIGFRLGVSTMSADFETPELTLVRIGNEAAVGEFTHVLNANFSDVGLEPYIMYSPISNFSLHLGSRVAYIYQKTYSQKETITRPKDRGVFVDTKKRTRNEQNGDIQEAASFFSSIVFGVSYDLPLNSERSLMIAPELFYHLGISNMVTPLSWTANLLKPGIAIKYAPVSKEPELLKESRTIYKIDTVHIENFDVIAEGFVLGSESTSSITTTDNKPDIIVETTTNTVARTDTIFKRPIPIVKIRNISEKIEFKAESNSESFPLLPVVFFDRESADLKQNYKISSNSNFNQESIANSPLSYHNNVLNLLGKRLLSLPNATIKISGYIDKTTENSDCNLAQARAATVRNYLNSAWGIDLDRMELVISGDCFPEEYSESKDEMAYAENRRVEISSDFLELFDPIRNRQVFELTDFTPKDLEFDVSGSTTKSISKWVMNIYQNDNLIASRQFNAVAGKISFPMDKKIVEQITSSEPLRIELLSEDISGNSNTDHTFIKVEKEGTAYEISSLALILFKVNDSNLPQGAKNSIKEFANKINSESEIRIYGYTDILGSKALNNKLAQKRADRTAEEIRKYAPDANIVQIIGIGSKELPKGIDSYDSPEERFLSRTVRIMITNPKK